MSKLFELLLKYIGIPLLQKLGGIVVEWVKTKYEQHKENKKIKAATKKIKDSKNEQTIVDNIDDLNL